MEFATPAPHSVLLAFPLQLAPPANQTFLSILANVFVLAFLRRPKRAHSVAQELTTFNRPVPANSAPLKRQTVPLVTPTLANAQCAHKLTPLTNNQSNAPAKVDSLTRAQFVKL